MIFVIFCFITRLDSFYPHRMQNECYTGLSFNLEGGGGYSLNFWVEVCAPGTIELSACPRPLLVAVLLSYSRLGSKCLYLIPD